MAFDWQNSVSPPDGTPNRHLGTRFDASGRFLPEAGNTVVAQVVPGSATEAALIWLRGALMALPCADHFAFTEVASFHMTVFEGVIDTRRQADHWPPGVPLDASIDAATAAMAARLHRLSVPQHFAIRPVAVTPFGLALTGATPQDDTLARDWRDALATAFGFRAPTHDSYRFHTTLAYCRRWLPASALPDYAAEMQRLSAEFLERVSVMDLARPAFCRFADMNAFPPVVAL